MKQFTLTADCIRRSTWALVKMAMLSRLGLLTAILLLIQSNVTGQETPDCFEEGECMESLLVEHWSVEDAQACLDQCKDNGECEYFTFYDDENSCNGLANCETFSSDTCSNCYSGAKSCEDLQCWEQGLCSGVLIGETTGEDSDSCLETCQLNDNCLWLTHDANDGVCLLFQDCQSIDSSCTTCLSSQRQCSPRPDSEIGYTKLIVFGGNNDMDGELSSAEVIDLASTSTTCSPIADFPEADGGKTAVGVINGVVKSCGGFDNIEECYDYIPSSNTWVSSPSLSYDRYAPRASFIGGIWLVSGDEVEEDCETTEVWAGSTFESGPTLPVCLERHCQVTVNSTHVFFADGINFESSYLLEWETQTWTELPNMATERVYLSCGLINNPIVGPEVVVVEEGVVEIFNFDTLDWRYGPEAPYFTAAGYTQLGDTFIVAGGLGAGTVYDLDTIYMFDHINYEWIELEQKLQTPRGWYPGVVAVPDDFVSCTGTY